MFGPFYNGDSPKPFITRAPFVDEENVMGSITDRFNNVSQQTFRAAIASPEALKELRDAVKAFMAEIEMRLPAEPVAESEWVPPSLQPVEGLDPSPPSLKRG
jgi:hypothetical protein